MNGRFIRLSKSSISMIEKNAVLKVLEKEFLGMGEEVNLFEKELKSYLATDSDVICVNTGTSALHLSLSALGIGRGDEVLVPSLTYIASFQAISATGATPIACDVDEQTGFIDIHDAESRMSTKVKAIMPVHYASNVNGMEKVQEFAKKYHLNVVEDAAHSFGGNCADGAKIGQLGDIICFSFDGIKNITSGEGGAIICSDKEVSNRLKDMRLLGVEKDTEKRYAGQRSWDFDVTLQGYRYHMSNIMAALGRVQLSRVNTFILKRQSIMRQYLEGLQIKEIQFFDFNYPLLVPHIFVIKAKNRDKLRNYLLQKGIESGIHYKPNHLLTKYKTSYALPVVEHLFNNIITLPCHYDLTTEEQAYVIQSINEFYYGK